MTRGFWGEAIGYVCYLKNRSPTKRLKDKTPYEVWTGKKPDVSNVRIFGCTAYHYNVDPSKKKLDDRSIKCRFLGISGQNQFRLWDPSAKKVIISANILWDETDAGWSKENLKDEESELGIFLYSNTDDESADTSTAIVSAPGEKTPEPITAAEVIEEASNLTESGLEEGTKDNDMASTQLITENIRANLPIAPCI